MTLPVAPRAKRGAIAAVVITIVFWTLGALLVIGADRVFEPLSPIASVVAKALLLTGVAFTYVRVMRHVTLDGALCAGVAWIVLSIIAEVAIASFEGHGWYVLLGSPAHDRLRVVLMLVWASAPAVFANARD